MCSPPPRAPQAAARNSQSGRRDPRPLPQCRFPALSPFDRIRCGEDIPPSHRDSSQTGGSANITVRSLSTPDPGCHRAVQQKNRSLRPRCRGDSRRSPRPNGTVPSRDSTRMVAVRHSQRSADAGMATSSKPMTGSHRTGHAKPLASWRLSVSQAEVRQPQWPAIHDCRHRALFDRFLRVRHDTDMGEVAAGLPRAPTTADSQKR